MTHAPFRRMNSAPKSPKVLFLDSRAKYFVLHTVAPTFGPERKNGTQALQHEVLVSVAYDEGMNKLESRSPKRRNTSQRLVPYANEDIDLKEPTASVLR